MSSHALSMQCIQNEAPLRSRLLAQMLRMKDGVEVGIVGVHRHEHPIEEAQAEAIHVFEGAVAVKHMAEEVEHVRRPRAVKRQPRAAVPRYIALVCEETTPT